METVSSVMPLAAKTGARAIGSVIGSAVGSAVGGGGSKVSDIAEARADQVENQAQRQAESMERQTRQQVDDQRDDTAHQLARARVAAANSGLELSGSSLLNLTSLEQAGADKANDLMDESDLRVRSLLDSASDQARSIRLSGRVANDRLDGVGSLLRLGAQAVRGLAKPTVMTIND